MIDPDAWLVFLESVFLCFGIHFLLMVVINLSLAFHKNMKIVRDSDGLIIPGRLQSRIAGICWGLFYLFHWWRVG